MIKSPLEKVIHILEHTGYAPLELKTVDGAKLIEGAGLGGCRTADSDEKLDDDSDEADVET